MSRMCGKTSAKDKASKTFYKKFKPALRDALPVSRAGADCKCVNCSKPDSQHKMKRLRTHKERNQMRDGKESSKAKPCHYHCSHQSSKDISHVHQCCHNTFVSDKLPNIVSATREPSVITDSRLIGHHGLFNHKIKSINIERLLSEQRKLETSGQIEKKSSARFNLSAVGSPSLVETRLSDSTDDTAGTSKEKNLPSTKTFNDLQDQQNKTLQYSSQASDLTPGQRPMNAFNPSTDSNKKYDSSKQSSSDIVIIDTKEVQPSLHEHKTVSHQTPSGCEDNVNSLIKPIQLQSPSSVERTPKNPATPSASKRQVIHSSPLQPTSLPTANSSNNIYGPQPNLNTDSVAMSVKAVAASLCESVSFSRTGKRNLVKDSRESLMKALRQEHGAQLQRNISEVRRHFSFDAHVQKDLPGMCRSEVFFNDEGPFGTDKLTTPFKVTSPFFVTSTFETARKPQFNWNSTDWSKCDKTSEWLGTPVEKHIDLDDTFSRCSPQFCMDFDFPNAFSTEMELLLPQSSTPSCLDGLGSSGGIDNTFVRTKSPQLPIFDPTQNFMSPSDTISVRHSRSSFSSDINTHYRFAPHLSAEWVVFPEGHSSFETYNHCFDNSFLDKILLYQQEKHLEPFSHSRHLPAPPALRSYHLDLAQFPPSYMLERDSTLSSTSSFLSPEHWSFPPMKLY